MYESKNDAAQYLRNSIIRYKKVPVFVEEIGDGKVRNPKLYLRSLTDNALEEVFIKDPKLDFKPVPLGYGDIEGAKFYISRRPVRKWKQGLSNDNIVIHNSSHTGINLGSIRDRKALAKTIQGKYKTYKKALAEGGAFHRYFYISKRDDDFLEYKGNKVGQILNEKIVLDEKYVYLENMLEDIL